jgi:DNA-binding GntR family transcriptional regulator
LTYEQTLTEHQRLTVLRLLAEGGYESNESILQFEVNRRCPKCTRDKVRTLISWLKDQGLVTINDVSGFMVARITQSGLDAAKGLSVVPGVQPPSPGMG